MKIGDIVYFDNLVFKDKIKDNKEHRPCIVLAHSLDKVAVVPLTSQVKSFNRYNFKYSFIPIVIYNYHKFSFASLENLMINPIDEANGTGLSIDVSVVNQIYEKILKNPMMCDQMSVHMLYEMYGEQVKQKQLEKVEQRKMKRLYKKQQKLYVSKES